MTTPLSDTALRQKMKREGFTPREIDRMLVEEHTAQLRRRGVVR